MQIKNKTKDKRNENITKKDHLIRTKNSPIPISVGFSRWSSFFL